MKNEWIASHPSPLENGAFFRRENRDETCQKCVRIHFQAMWLWLPQYHDSCFVFLKWNVVKFRYRPWHPWPLACLLCNDVMISFWSVSARSIEASLLFVFQLQELCRSLSQITYLFHYELHTLWIANIWITQRSFWGTEEQKWFLEVETVETVAMTELRAID